MGRYGSVEESFQIRLGSTESLPTVGPRLTDLTDFFGRETGGSIDKGSILSIANINNHFLLMWFVSSVVEVANGML